MIKNIAMITSTKRTIMLMKLAVVNINTSTVMKPTAMNTPTRTKTGMATAMGTAATNTRMSTAMRIPMTTKMGIPTIMSTGTVMSMDTDTITRRTFMIRSMRLTLIVVPRGFALS